jgi:hypothetical protein
VKTQTHLKPSSLFLSVLFWSFFVTCKGYTIGPGIGGGGNITCGNVPVSSIQQLIEIPKSHPLLSQGWLYVDQLNENLNTNSREDLKQYLNFFINSKKWYLYSCAFDPLPNSQIGTEAPTEQTIRQFPTEIHISKPLLQKLLSQKNGLQSLRELLLREQLEALKLLAKDSNYNQCLSIAPESWLCNDNSKDVKSQLELNGQDHAQVREITRQLIPQLNNHTFSLESFINSLIKYDFDLYDGWLYGLLPSVSIDENTLKSWQNSWEQNAALIKIRPELSTCHKNQILSFTKTDAKNGIYTLKIKYDKKVFDLTLQPDPLITPRNQNGLKYKLTTNYDENSGQPIVKFSANTWLTDTNMIKKIGAKYPVINLLFTQEGSQMTPSGYEFEGHITTRINDDGSVSGIIEDHEICNF